MTKQLELRDPKNLVYVASDGTVYQMLRGTMRRVSPKKQWLRAREKALKKQKKDKEKAA